MTHELGHTLGLGHSPWKDSIMYSEYNYDKNSDAHMTDDDIRQIQAMYGCKFLSYIFNNPPGGSTGEASVSVRGKDFKSQPYISKVFFKNWI